MADMTIPQWYILQTVYGQEQSAQENLKQMIKINQMENEIFDVVLPQEEETVERNGKMKKVIKNKYPNYLFIHMIYSKNVWYMVKNTRGVKDFLKDFNGKPIPMQPEEVKRTQLEAVKVEDLDIVVGNTVKIISGPFSDWFGDVIEIKPAEQKIKVNIQIYGRSTPIDLDLNQVEKI